MKALQLIAIFILLIAITMLHYDNRLQQKSIQHIEREVKTLQKQYHSLYNYQRSYIQLLKLEEAKRKFKEL